MNGEVHFFKGFYNYVEGGSSTVIKLYCAFRGRTMRKSVQVVDEEQDVFLLWPNAHGLMYIKVIIMHMCNLARVILFSCNM